MTDTARRCLFIWAAVVAVVGTIGAAGFSTPAAVASPAGTALAPAIAPLSAEAPVTVPVAPVVVAPATDAAESTPTAPLVRDNGIAETWGVIVGADDYNGLDTTLAAGIADASATAHALDIAFGVDAAHRQLLLGDAVTGQSVTDALAWLVSVAGPEDDAIFFYAGHVRHLGGNTQALFLPDGSLLPDVELAAALADLQAARTWLPIAGCFAGGFDELLAPGRILTAASAADELSYENLDLGHSYLVQYVIIDGLLGRDGATVESAVAEAMERLAVDFPNRLPVQFDMLDGEFGAR